MLGKPYKPNIDARGTIGKPIRKMSDLGRAVLLQDETPVAGRVPSSVADIAALHAGSPRAAEMLRSDIAIMDVPEKTTK